MTLANIDLAVIAAYAIFIFGLAQWVSREKAGHAKDTSDYFLASKSLPRWAIGASLILLAPARYCAVTSAPWSGMI